MKKTIFHLFIRNWRRNPARAIFKNSKFSLWVGKTWRYRLRPTLKNPNFESMDELNKVGSWCKFTVENKTCNKMRYEWWMRYSVTLNFKNLSINWEKYVFYYEKWKFYASWIAKALNKNIDYLMYYLSRQHVIWKHFSCKFTFKIGILWRTRS